MTKNTEGHFKLIGGEHLWAMGWSSSSHIMGWRPSRLIDGNDWEKLTAICWGWQRETFMVACLGYVVENESI